MAQFDIFHLGDGYVVDVQSELLSDLRSRVVVPLLVKMIWTRELISSILPSRSMMKSGF
ncbi:MAG: CcdB family protein [Pseudomonadota bacterium]